MAALSAQITPVATKVAGVAKTTAIKARSTAAGVLEKVRPAEANTPELLKTRSVMRPGALNLPKLESDLEELAGTRKVRFGGLSIDPRHELDLVGAKIITEEGRAYKPVTDQCWKYNPHTQELELLACLLQEDDTLNSPTKLRLNFANKVKTLVEVP